MTLNELFRLFNQFSNIYIFTSKKMNSKLKANLNKSGIEFYPASWEATP